MLLLLRPAWMLRRRSCTAPALLLALAALVFYHTSTVDRPQVRDAQRGQRNKSGRDGVLALEPEQLHSLLEVHWSKRSCGGKAIVLTGQHTPSDTEVQLYQRVLREQGYHVGQGRYAETSAGLRHDGKDGQEWSLLICLKGSEKSCLRKINVAHPKPYQRVNIIPAFVGAFLDMGGVCRFLTDSHLTGMSLPVIPAACAFSRPGTDGTEEDWSDYPYHREWPKFRYCILSNAQRVES